MTYIVMAYKDMAYIAMAFMVMAAGEMQGRGAAEGVRAQGKAI